MYSVLPMISAIFSLGFGMYIIYQKGITRLSSSFLILCITTFFWQCTWAVLFQVRNPDTAVFLIKLGYMLIFFLPTSLYHFLTEITEKTSERPLVYVSYLIAVLFGITLISSDLFVDGYYDYFWGYYPKAGLLHPLHVLQTIIVVNRGFYITWKKQKTAPPDQRKQLQYCLVSLFIYFFAAFDYLCNYGVAFYPPGVLFILISLTTLAIAMVKFKLMNMPATHPAHFEFTQAQLPYFGVLGLVCYPLMFVIFTYIFPQPYESLLLRGMAFISFIPLVFVNHWSGMFKKFLPVYVLYCLFVWIGVYFSYMVNMNDASSVWSACLIFGLILIFKFLDWLTASITAFFSCLTGLVIFQFSNVSVMVSHDVIGTYMLVLISITSWIFLSIRTQKITEIRQEMLSFGGKIAHDIRIPLTTLQMTLSNIENHIPELVKAYVTYVPHKEQSFQILRKYKLLENISGNMSIEIERLMLMVSMLLKSLRSGEIDNSDFVKLPVKKEIEKFIESHPFFVGEEKKLKLKIEQDFNVMADSSLFQTVLYNLISNALYAISDMENGEITIQLQSSDNQNQLIIKDNGIGISSENLPYIFNQFYSTKNYRQGTGLGLSKVKDIVRAFGGEISCQSVSHKVNEKQQGTTFYLRFNTKSDL